MPRLCILLLPVCSLLVLAPAGGESRPTSVWASVGPQGPGTPSIWAPVGHTPQQDFHNQVSIDDASPRTPSNRPSSMQDNSYQQIPSNHPLNRVLTPAQTSATGNTPRGSPRTSHGKNPFIQVPPREPFQCIACKDPSKFRPLHWDSIIYMILDRVTHRMHVGNEFELLNHQCAYHTRPLLMNWSMHILAKVWCPGWVNLSGTAITDRIPKSIEFATRDFVMKALQAGVVSQEDARPWLSNLP